MVWILFALWHRSIFRIIGMLLVAFLIGAACVTLFMGCSRPAPKREAEVIREGVREAKQRFKGTTKTLKNFRIPQKESPK